MVHVGRAEIVVKVNKSHYYYWPRLGYPQPYKIVGNYTIVIREGVLGFMLFIELLVQCHLCDWSLKLVSVLI